MWSQQLTASLNNSFKNRRNVIEQVTVAVTLKTCTWDMLRSGLGWYNWYLDCNVPWFSCVPQGNWQFITSGGSLLLPFISFWVFYLFVVLPLAAVWCETWTASWNKHWISSWLSSMDWPSAAGRFVVSWRLWHFIEVRESYNQCSEQLAFFRKLKQTNLILKCTVL
jgi:hypothetical protein